MCVGFEAIPLRTDGIARTVEGLVPGSHNLTLRVGVLLHDEECHVGARELPVEHGVGDTDLVRRLEQTNGIVVDVDLGDPIGADRDDRGREDENRLSVAKALGADGLDHATEEAAVICVALAPEERSEALFRQRRDVRRNEEDREDECQADAERYERAEHAHGWNRRHHQRKETSRRRKRGVQHGCKEVANYLLDRSLAISMLRIDVDELREEMNRVDDRYGHQEYRDHRAHDVHREPARDQRPHRDGYRRERDNHRRENQGEGAEEPPHQQEDDEGGERRGDRHLLEHLNAERVFRDRKSRDVKLVSACVEAVDDRPNLRGDTMALILTFDRDVQRDTFAIVGHDGPAQHRQPKGGFLDCERLFGRLGCLLHQPLEADGPGTCLLDVVHGRRSEDVACDDAVDRLQLLIELVNAGERFGVEDPLRLGLVHDAHDDQVVKSKLLLGLVVKDPRWIVLGEHGLRIGIDLDRWNGRSEADGEDGQADEDQACVLEGKIENLSFHAINSV